MHGHELIEELGDLVQNANVILLAFSRSSSIESHSPSGPHSIFLPLILTDEYQVCHEVLHKPSASPFPVSDYGLTSLSSAESPCLGASPDTRQYPSKTVPIALLENASMWGRIT